jgi:hypothetical protein
MSGPIGTTRVEADPNGQHALARELTEEFASVLRRMEAFDGVGEKAASRILSALPDARRLGDRLASLDFAFGPGVDHSFASWQLRMQPDEEDPEGEVQTEAALAIMLLNEAVFTNEHRSTRQGADDLKGATSLYVTCNDVFAWGCADLEDMRHDQIAEVFGYWEKDPGWGTAVWCMIQRGQMPQRPIMDRIARAGIWDLEAIAAEHGLNPNHYDGISMEMARRKYRVYCDWRRSLGGEPMPFDASWWTGWKEFTTANPEWYDESWKTEDDRLRREWRAANGYRD